MNSMKFMDFIRLLKDWDLVDLDEGLESPIWDWMHAGELIEAYRHIEVEKYD